MFYQLRVMGLKLDCGSIWIDLHPQLVHFCLELSFFIWMCIFCATNMMFLWTVLFQREKRLWSQLRNEIFDFDWRNQMCINQYLIYLIHWVSVPQQLILLFIREYEKHSNQIAGFFVWWWRRLLLVI